MRFPFAVLLAASLAIPALAQAAESPFPEINDLELQERLKDAGAKLLKEGKGKGSKELLPGLQKTQAELALVPAQTTRVNDEELYRRACDSVFIVCGLFKDEKSGEWEGAFATAFAVAADGVLTTSRHFFDDPQMCEVFLAVDSRGTIYPIEEILASQEKMDTCLFRIPAKDLKPLPLGASPSPGSRARVVSHPGYFFYFFSAGQVGNYFKDEDKLRWMNITADFGQGASGAPVFDRCGNVIGQVSSTLTLYASGPLLEEPAISRRHFTRKPPMKEKPKVETPEPKDKKKKKPKPMPKPEPEPKPEPVEEISDPQMVFKTCTPVEAMREMFKSP